MTDRASEGELLAPLSERFDRALLYASALHRRQARKGTQIPYLSHLLGVAAIVLENGGTEDEAIAALLHDAIEDHGERGTAEEIREQFGAEVLATVRGCSDREAAPKPPWPERKQAFVRRLRAAPRSVRLVSAADKLYNARTLLKNYRRVGDALWEQFTGTRDQLLWYYSELVDALTAAERNPVVDELERVVQRLSELAGRVAPLRCPSCGRRTSARSAPFCSETCGGAPTTQTTTPTTEA